MHRPNVKRVLAGILAIGTMVFVGASLIASDACLEAGGSWALPELAM